MLVEALKAAGPPPRGPDLARRGQSAVRPWSASRASPACRSPRSGERSRRACSSSTPPAPERSRPDNGHRVARLGGRGLCLRLRHGLDGSRALGGRGHVDRRGRRGQPSVVKSSECELGLRAVVRESVSASIEYCSGLRSCGELEIARWFADLTAYHSGFLSCNHAYRQGGASTPGAATAPSAASCSWCWRRSSPPTGSRPSSATTSSRTPTQVEGFWDLCAGGRKPFEWVGQQRGIALAFLLVIGPARRGAPSAVVVALREMRPAALWWPPTSRAAVPVIERVEVARGEVVIRVQGSVTRAHSARGGPSCPVSMNRSTWWSAPDRALSDSLIRGEPMILDSINSPADLKALSLAECDQLAGEIRDFIVAAVSRTGGHLGSNLGVVELTLALHRVFDSPRGHLLVRHRSPGLRPQARHRPRQGFAGAQAARRAVGIPLARRVAHDRIENSHASTALAMPTASRRPCVWRARGPRRRAAATSWRWSATAPSPAGRLRGAQQPRPFRLARVLIVLNDNGRSYAPTVSRLSGSSPSCAWTRVTSRSESGAPPRRDIPVVGASPHSPRSTA